MNKLKFKYSESLNKNIDKNYYQKIKNSKKFIDIIKNSKSINIVNEKKDIEEIIYLSKKFKNFKEFCIIGTGGSSLGSQALIASISKFRKKNFYFFENIDPIFTEIKIKKINLAKTCFIVISKSGNTSETLALFSIFIKKFEVLNLNMLIPKNFIVITENKNNPMVSIANKYKIKLLPHDQDIGGRFSVFSNVALLPAYLAGFDIIKFRKGAKKILNQVVKKNNLLPLKGAAILASLYEIKKININVMLTYTDSLKKFGMWHRQLWAESIGKQGIGTTPVHFEGTVDQHSQIQLYLDGPKDKYYTFLTTCHANKGQKMDKKNLSAFGLHHMAGNRIGDLMEFEQKACIQSLANNKLPFREIFINEINEETIGYLMMYFFLETICASIIWDINCFNQPAVEEIKVLTKKYLLKKSK